MKYRFFEHTADIGFEAHGKNLNELFRSCASAVFDLTADIKKIEGKKEKKFRLTADNVEHLLYDFLSEILYIRDVNSFIFKDCKIKIKEGKNYVLNAILIGEPIDRKRHELRREVKAVTMHEFTVKKSSGKWKARIILDI